MAPAQTRETLQRAISILRSDAPAAFMRMAAELDGLDVALEVEGERFGVSTCDCCVTVGERHLGASVEVHASRRIILALIDGERSVLQAVLGRELALRGHSSVLPRLARATVAFSDGAIRSPRMRALLDQYRAS